MKKQLLKIFLLVATVVLLFTFSVSASAVLSTVNCKGESAEVTTFEELKAAMEGSNAYENIVLKKSINVTGDTENLTISVTKPGSMVLDLNGYQLTVNSKATKYLFKVTEQTDLYFLNSKSNKSVIVFNTTTPKAAMVYVKQDLAGIYNINVDFTMGDTYKKTTDSSDTAIFYVDRAAEMNIFGGVMRNEMTNGNGVYIAQDSENQSGLSFRVGGYAEIEATKYCIDFDPGYVKYENFGSVRLESVNSNKGLYERIKVPASSLITLSDLWSSAAGSSSAIYLDGVIVTNHDKKITSLSKVDIKANKTCDSFNNADDFILIRCAGGHVELCGVCFMKYNGVNPHNFQTQMGQPASCTTSGKTSGERCKDCKYSTRKTIPAKGHEIIFVEYKAPSCGVDGMQEHYYCNSCYSFYSDSAGKNKIDEKTLKIENNHDIKNVSGVPATCTKEGSTSGVYCNTCKKYSVEPEIIPKKDHNYPNAWTLKYNSTCKYEGLRTKECSRCGNVLEDVIAKAAHIDRNDDNICDECDKRLSGSDVVVPDGPDYPDTPDDPDNSNTPDGGNDNPQKNCKCNCHASGIKKFFFKIGLFFQRIFKANKYCKGCGVAHY